MGQDAWAVELFIRHHKVKSKIDTCADVTVIPESTFREITKGTFILENPDKSLLGVSFCERVDERDACSGHMD